MIEVYRLHRSIYLPNQGIGAFKSGGRWTPKGMHAIYAAESRALAALEVLVHYSTLPIGFSITSIRIPPRLNILHVRLPRLSPDWKDNLTVTQTFGLACLGNRLVMCVPSAVIPGERNYIFNPEHPDFHRIRFLESISFSFDPRLKPVL